MLVQLKKCHAVKDHFKQNMTKTIIIALISLKKHEAWLPALRLSPHHTQKVVAALLASGPLIDKTNNSYQGTTRGNYFFFLYLLGLLTEKYLREFYLFYNSHCLCVEQKSRVQVFWEYNIIVHLSWMAVDIRSEETSQLNSQDHCRVFVFTSCRGR